MNQRAFVAGAEPISSSQTIWSPVNLSSDTYAIISTVSTNPTTRCPVTGLIRVFTVTGGLTVG